MFLTDTKVAIGCVAVILAAVATTVVLTAQSDRSHTWNPDTAAAYLDERQEWWTTWETASRDSDTYCISCHGGVPYALARPHLSPRPSSTDPYGPTATERALLDNITTRVRRWESIGPYYTDERFGVPKTKESRGTEAILNAFVLSRYDALSGTLSSDTRTAFDHLWSTQEQSGENKGGWPWLVFGLQPWESQDSPFYGAALAAVAVGMAPGGYASTPQVQERVGLLTEYFARHYEAQPLFNRMTLLWAASKLPGVLAGHEQRVLVDEVFGLQREDGGWSLTDLGVWERRDGTTLDTRSDGYATGLVTFALQQSGLASDDARLGRARAWLRQHQHPTEGSWPGYSLNEDRDPSSHTGRFMSDVATAYAVLALADAP